MNRYLAELFGTFILVFIGISSIVTGGFGGALPIGQIGIGLSFGLALTAAIYTVGVVSGAHLNPAVTVGAWLADRFPVEEVVPYIIAQVIGAIIAAGVLLAIVKCQAAGYDPATAGLGETGWNPAGFNVAAVFATEAIATFLFVTVILAVTAGRSETALAGLIIGLTLAILHFAFIPVSGNSLNPARSIGPAVFVGGEALSQLWLYVAAPIVGGAVAGLASKYDYLNWGADNGSKKRKKR